MSRTEHIATDNIIADTLKVGFSNFIVSGSAEVAIPGSTTYKLAVEYPAGTIYPCTFSGATTVTATTLGQLISDVCGPGIPFGAQFWTRTLLTNTSGIALSNIGASAAIGDAGTSGTGTPLDLVDSGSMTPYLGGTMFVPAFIIDITTRPSIALAGDSRVNGILDTVGISGDLGELQRSVGPAYAWVNLAVTGETLTAAISNYTQRAAIGVYGSHYIDEYGINDIDSSTSATTLAGLHTSFAAMVAKPTFGTTIPPTTTSTDDWATVANQAWASAPNQAQWVSYNGLQRAGISGEVGNFDIASSISTPAGLWFANGTAFAYTGDGNHETQGGALLEQASNVLDTRRICPTCGVLPSLPASTIAGGGETGYPFLNGSQQTTYTTTIPAATIGVGTFAAGMTIPSPIITGTPDTSAAVITGPLVATMVGSTLSDPTVVGIVSNGAPSNSAGLLQLGSTLGAGTTGIYFNTNSSTTQFDSFWTLVLAGNQFTNMPQPTTGNVNLEATQIWAPGPGFSSPGGILGLYNGTGTTRLAYFDQSANFISTGSVSTPQIALNAGTPWTSSSSANSQVVTCPTGGTGTQVCSASGAWISSGGSSSLSGMTAGQIPIAATANTVTSSIATTATGAVIVKGPSTTVAGDLVYYPTIDGSVADSNFPLSNVPGLSSTNTFTGASNTFTNPIQQTTSTSANVFLGAVTSGVPIAGGTSATISSTNASGKNAAVVQTWSIANADGSAHFAINQISINADGVGTPQVIATGSTPTMAPGAGAGTSPTCTSITGANMAGVITCTTGTLPTVSSTLATITFFGTLGTAPQGCTLMPRNALTALALTSFYTTAPTTTSWTIATTTTVLAAATTYSWSYSCE
jgi:hypothetical protein